MKLTAFFRVAVGLAVMLSHPPRRSERGLSQSAEIAILIGGAAVVALSILTFIGPYVASKLPK